MLNVPSPILVHIQGTSHRSIQICQSHKHVIVSRPYVKTMRYEAAIFGEQNLFVSVSMATEHKQDISLADVAYHTAYNNK